jgi:hypothetical protein
MSQSGKLCRSDGGAVMLIAVFFCIFAVAMLYLAIGAGEAVLFREHLQDAADSAALSGAIVHARLMNVLVLLNVVMAVLLAILVTIKLIEGICYVGMVICSGLAWVTAGVTMAAIPPLASLAANMANLYTATKPHVFNALELLHDIGDQIVTVAPEASDAVVQAAIAENGQGVVAAGFAAPTTDTLPVDDDRYELLCEKAGQMALKIATIPLAPIPGLKDAMGALNGPMGTMTGALSEWFCGDGQNRLPNLDQSLDQSYPRTNATVQCQTSKPSSVAPGDEKAATSEECRRADAENRAAEPDASGNCQSACEVGGPYDQAVTNARQMCDPSRNPRPKQYRYQIQEGKVDYAWNGSQWQRLEPHFVKSYVNEAPNDTPPCSDVPSSSNGLGETAEIPVMSVDGICCGIPTPRGFLVGYNQTVRRVTEPNRVLPVCTNECAPQLRPPEWEKNPLRTVAFRQVTHILSCERNERVSVPVKDEKSPGETNGDAKSPKKVMADASLGSEQFQLRAIVVGDMRLRESARLVRLGLWRTPDPNNPLERLRELGGFSLAQSEYFYDAAGGRDAWMWNMNWRARLRRFELPNTLDAASRLRAKCSLGIAGSRCAKLLNLIADFNELLVH